MRKLRERIRKLIQGRDRSVLLSLATGLFGLLLMLGFLVLGSEVLEGETRAFDSYMLDFANSQRQRFPALADSMRDLSGVGSATVLTLLVMLAAGFLLLQAERITALLVVISTLSGIGAMTLLKSSFQRVRPHSALAQLVVNGPGFPSGHTSMSAVVFLTIGALLASTRTSWPERLYILFAAGLLTFLVGLSRVLLGVHWATDVIAGWAFGTAWAIAWVLAHAFAVHHIHRKAIKN
jgi:undecaprenyl-diphosphatase